MSYQQKDKIKFSICNKLITRGAVGSSSYKYAIYGIEGLDLVINSSSYVSTDIVGISTNGKRHNRISFDKSFVDKAIDAGVTFVIDNNYHASRSFNIGEIEVRNYLKLNSYLLFEDGNYRSIWKLNK